MHLGSSTVQHSGQVSPALVRPRYDYKLPRNFPGHQSPIAGWRSKEKRSNFPMIHPTLESIGFGQKRQESRESRPSQGGLIKRADRNRELILTKPIRLLARHQRRTADIETTKSHRHTTRVKSTKAEPRAIQQRWSKRRSYPRSRALIGHE